MQLVGSNNDISIFHLHECTKEIKRQTSQMPDAPTTAPIDFSANTVTSLLVPDAGGLAVHIDGQIDIPVNFASLTLYLDSNRTDRDDRVGIVRLVKRASTDSSAEWVSTTNLYNGTLVPLISSQWIRPGTDPAAEGGIGAVVTISGSSSSATYIVAEVNSGSGFLSGDFFELSSFGGFDYRFEVVALLQNDTEQSVVTVNGLYGKTEEVLLGQTLFDGMDALGSSFSCNENTLTEFIAICRDLMSVDGAPASINSFSRPGVKAWLDSPRLSTEASTDSDAILGFKDNIFTAPQLSEILDRVRMNPSRITTTGPTAVSKIILQPGDALTCVVKLYSELNINQMHILVRLVATA